MKKYTIIIFSIIFSTLILYRTSCVDKLKDEPEPNAKRTILIYMIASNSLSSCDIDDISEIESSIANNGMNNCRLLIYWVTYSNNPRLIEIKNKGNGTIRTEHKVYDNSIKSTTKERMQAVILDVKNIAPADDYGLILWSHGSGWASSLTARSFSASLTDFGDDRGSTMPIDELAQGIPNDMFTFIYTDACYMSGIEVVYELRDKTKFFIGSTTELPIDGMDYTNNIPCMFADELDLKACCENTFNKYDRLSGSFRSCTISLTDCSKLNNLATLCKEIHSNGISVTNDYNLQKYKRNEPYLFYDFVQYTKLIANEEQKEKLDSIMNEVIIYKAATPYIFNSFAIDMANYSGLSTYIVGMSLPTSVNEEYYRTLSWYKDVITQ